MSRLPWIVPLLLAFTTGTDPARHASTPATTNNDYIYVHDPAVSGTTTGVPNTTPKLVNCTVDQALGYNTSTHAFICLGVPTSGNTTLSSIPSGGTITAASLSGRALPNQAFTISAIAFKINVAGAAGATNVVFRTTDGTNNCDCGFACNTTAASTIVSCSGTAGTGCAFAANAALTYSWNSAGNCGTPPVALGNIDVTGTWQ